MSDSKSKETPAAAPVTNANTWTTWVALTTTILAVGAALSTMKGGGFATQTQLATVKAGNRWAHFQSKSLKETARETEGAIIKTIAAGATTPEARAVAEKAIEEAAAEVTRYKREKAVIQKEAQALDEISAYCQKRGGYLGLAAMFLQIAIMLSAIATLLKKKSSWILGLVLGTIGIGYLLYAWPFYETLVGAPPAPAVAAAK